MLKSSNGGANTITIIDANKEIRNNWLFIFPIFQHNHVRLHASMEVRAHNDWGEECSVVGREL